MEFALESSSAPAASAARTAAVANPVFGRVFTDHMISARWTQDLGWHDARLTAYAPLVMDPACVVLHYGQEIFEGLKAYRQPDGTAALFRPERNAARMTRSSERMALPAFPADAFVTACELLVRADRDWVPATDGASLYLRPIMFGDEVGLGVRPSASARFLIVASPAGNYFNGPPRPVSLWLSQQYTRAAPGGTGAAKTGGNYAGSLLSQQDAMANGCDQVVFLDATERRWIEELGGMNLFLVQDDGTLLTPPLGTILDGITRESVIELAEDFGHAVEERPIDINEWHKGAADGRITEAFACGTAAVITPVGALRWPGDEAVTGDGQPGPVTTKLREALVDIQTGRSQDPHGWRHPVPGT